jgi:two-component system, response regulator, stage 0 sporulation protein F
VPHDRQLALGVVCAQRKHPRRGRTKLFKQRFRREIRQGTHVLHSATSAEQALELLQSGIKPTLIVILSDINMPGMDGLTLLGEIKQRFPGLPVMIVSLWR